MKHRITICMDETLFNRVRETLKNRKYRNQSHLVEYAVEQLLEVKDNRGDSHKSP